MPAASITTHVNPKAVFHRRRFAGTLSRNRQTIITTPPPIIQPEPLKKTVAVCGPVVVTVSIAFPFVVTEAGLSEQLASFIATGTAQVTLTVPVNPLVALTVNVEVPDWPGLEMLRVVGLAVKVKSGGADVTVTVTATASEVEPA